MNVGKRIGSTLYVHRLAVSFLKEQYSALLQQALEILPPSGGSSFNVFKLDAYSLKVSFLEYSNFDYDPFPALSLALIFDLNSQLIRRRSYGKSENPPILHRKELLLPPDHPGRPIFARLTSELDALGLYEHSHQIGHSKQWAARLIQAKVIVRDHRVQSHPGWSFCERRPW